MQYNRENKMGRSKGEARQNEEGGLLQTKA